MFDCDLHRSRSGRLFSAVVMILLLVIGVYHGSGYPATLRTPFRHQSPSSKFAILCMTTLETSYDYMSFSNKHTYALKHGYDLIWDFEPTRHYLKVWDKLNISRDAISASLFGDRAYEWVWMLDFDTLITNTSIRVPDVIDQVLSFAETEGKEKASIDLVLTRDCGPLNLGSMFLRVSHWTLDFIEHWRAGADVLDDEGDLRNEQDVMRDMLGANDYSIADRSVLAPQWMFDAYPEEIDCYDPRYPGSWKPGMFLLHFAGARWRLPQLKDPVGSLMRKYFLHVV